MARKPRIAIVDDDEPVREAVAGLVRSLGFRVAAFPCAADLLAFPELGDISCLVTDVHMPGMTGLELHSRLIASGRAIPTILITAYPDEAGRDRALAAGIACYLSKPVDQDILLGCIRASLVRARPVEKARRRRVKPI